MTVLAVDQRDLVGVPARPLTELAEAQLAEAQRGDALGGSEHPRPLRCLAQRMAAVKIARDDARGAIDAAPE